MRNKTIRKLFCGVGLMGLIFCQGCLAAAVGYGAYKYSESKTESAEKARQSADLATYTKYRTEMERINFDRERSGLMPRPIMTQEEWTRAQTLSKTASTPASSATPPPAPAASVPSPEKTQAAMQ